MRVSQLPAGGPARETFAARSGPPAGGTLGAAKARASYHKAAHRPRKNGRGGQPWHSLDALSGGVLGFSFVQYNKHFATGTDRQDSGKECERDHAEADATERNAPPPGRTYGRIRRMGHARPVSGRHGRGAPG